MIGHATRRAVARSVQDAFTIRAIAALLSEAKLFSVASNLVVEFIKSGLGLCVVYLQTLRYAFPLLLLKRDVGAVHFIVLDEQLVKRKSLHVGDVVAEQSQGLRTGHFLSDVVALRTFHYAGVGEGLQSGASSEVGYDVGVAGIDFPYYPANSRNFGNAENPKHVPQYSSNQHQTSYDQHAVPRLSGLFGEG